MLWTAWLLSILITAIALLVIARSKRYSVKLVSPQPSHDISVNTETVTWLHRVASTEVVGSLMKEAIEVELRRFLMGRLASATHWLPLCSVTIEAYGVSPVLNVHQLQPEGGSESTPTRLELGGVVDAMVTIDGEIAVGYGLHLPFGLTMTSLEVQYAVADISFQSDSVRISLPAAPSFVATMRSRVGPQGHPLRLENCALLPWLLERLLLPKLFAKAVGFQWSIDGAALRVALGKALERVDAMCPVVPDDEEQ